MSQLVRAGQAGAVDVAADQATAKEQLATLIDIVRQLGGNPRVVSGSSNPADPLNAPFTLYVDPYIGSDRFVGGSYNSDEASGTDEEIIAQKLRRIELQRLECGYTAARPFKTINRAAIEAAIITSKSWYTYSDPRAHVDCVTIVLSGGVHIVYNDPGSGSTNLASWGSAKDPTIAELIAFNPSTGGVLLPRGCSMHGQDLRKTTVRPNWVTAVSDEAADYSNRRTIFKVSGTGFFFNASTMDKIGHTESCHLLDTFHPASRAELDAFYDKVESAVGTGADLASALLAARPSEYQIAGPIDQTQSATSAWDTTRGASPYIFNWSVRSDYGIGGAFWDGDKIEGLKSMVCANFTGTNIQKDMRAWQVYENGNWVSLTTSAQDYQKYIDTAPDNVRRNPARQTRHIVAINDAYIQKVSIFGIGQSEVTMVDSGGEITDNTGNSTFGGCSAVAKGYKRIAFPKDRNWTVGRLKAPLNVSEKTGNIRRIYLGTVSAVSSSMITLSTGLVVSTQSATVPAILLRDGYSLANGTRVWVENPIGPDWRATLTSTAWEAAAPTQIDITGQLLESGSNAAVGVNPQNLSLAVGRRVYVRRIIDTRSPAERRISMVLNNTSSVRLPQRNTVLQTDPARAGGAISRVLAGGGEEVLLVTAVGTGPTPGAGVTKTCELTIRRGAADKVYAAGVYYPVGTVVRHGGKHWQSKVAMVSVGAAPDSSLWGECYVHMPSAFNPEDNPNNEAPILTFDTDTADTEDSVTLGIDWATIWTAASTTRTQYRSGTDYLGAYAFLRALGFSDAAAHDALVPRTAALRERDPNSAVDFPTAPAGGAATGRGYWAVEFRRPSTIRLYNHQWEWAGFGNYSKALPGVQQDMSEFNKFTYYFTSATGGRVTPKGSNEDGFEVTPRGLEDIATGATTTLENLGGQDIDAAQTQDFTSINVTGTATVQDLEILGTVSFPSTATAKTDELGAVQLANYDKIRAVPSDVNYEVASSDASIEANPEVVTIAALNRWRIAQQLVSTKESIIPIYVKAGATDRNLDSMFETAPTSPGAAIPTLARASEYANALIGSGNQIAEIRMAPGLYNPSSVWECNVKFVAYNAALTTKTWASDSVGTSGTPNNYFDGSGYDNFSAGINFHSFALILRPALTAGNALHVNCVPLNMRFSRDVDYEGGFHFLGIAQIIKAVANNLLPASSFIYNSPGFIYPSSAAYTVDVDTNVDTLLNAIRIANSRTANYDSWTASSLIVILGGTDNSVSIRDCVFGPGLPSRKDSLGGTRDALIRSEGLAEIGIRNCYIRGKTTITTAGMFSGIANGSIVNLPQSGSAHYGSAAVTAPWTWSQTYHTFIGTRSGDFGDIKLRFGGTLLVDTNPGVNGGFSYYEDLTGKTLPNHIHLLTVNGTAPGNDTTGPYFDQFIHAPARFSAVNVWQRVGEAQGGVAAARLRLQGFVGRFGSNGYNSVKTRGVLGGNIGIQDPETGFTLALPPGAGANGGRSLFQRAGLSNAEGDNTSRPLFDSSSTTPGEGFPTGNNPVITTATPYGPDGLATGLNVALRSYLLGISTTRAITIPSSNVIL